MLCGRRRTLLTCHWSSRERPDINTTREKSGKVGRNSPEQVEDLEGRGGRGGNQQSSVVRAWNQQLRHKPPCEPLSHSGAPVREEPPGAGEDLLCVHTSIHQDPGEALRSSYQELEKIYCVFTPPSIRILREALRSSYQELEKIYCVFTPPSIRILEKL
ncbi:unnamed protein product [Pleuronectes platessa]|uniref:Uncharacterized protein n=1 Tax=Pleuronectes platessa TaxID=8262 RepID=A0A9N7YLZ0_PLEPL|nr:unnamed protein product [Pleuronectes platessa]